MVKLSASKIKTLAHCSWIYYATYVLKLPRSTNDGARAGTVIHLLLECLLNKRHNKHREAIVKAGNIYASPACVKLVAKSMKREGLVDTPENWEKISDFSLVALKNDFYVEGFELQDPEWAFDIQNENPSYSINGFIDKLAFKGNVAKVTDYKSSKSKFSAEEQKFNIQAWMYALAIMKKYPNIKKVFINFLFLKFKKAPLQVVSPTKKELEGFESYLDYLNKYLADFDFKKACSSFGADNYKMKNLCGTREDRFKDDGSPKWRCPSMEPRPYWVEVDENGKDRKSSFEESDLKDSKYRVEKRSYKGCPKFYPENYR